VRSPGTDPPAVDGASGAAAPDVHIAVPVYNNRGTVRSVAEALLAHGLPVVVVDDGSDDGSAEALAGLGVALLRHDRNRGKGAALLTAAEYIQDHGGTHLICFDGDGQLDPADIPRVLFWTRVTTGQKVLDSQCGFRAYPLPVLLGLSLHGRRYDLEVEGVPVNVTYDPPGGRVTHFRPFVDNARISHAYTRLVLRSMLPVPHQVIHQGPGAAGQAVLSPWRPARLLRALLQERSSPGQLAAAAALGFLLATLPFIGFHSLVIVFAATLLRLNRLLALSVSSLCAPPVIPAVCLEVGFRLRHGSWLSTFNAETLWHQIGDRFLEYVLGTLVVAPALAVAGGALVWLVASAMVRRPPRILEKGAASARRLMGRYGSRWGIGFVRLVLRLLGLRAAYFILWFVVPYYVMLRPSARRSIYPYLRRRFPSAGRLGLVLHSFRSIMALARAMVDHAAVAIMGPNYFDFKGVRRAELAKLLESEGGVVLLISHVGNWKAITSALDITHKPVNLLLFRDPSSPVAGPKGAPEVLGSAKIIDPTGPFGGLVAAADALIRHG